MTIIIKEWLISWYKPLKNKWHSVTITIKQEDISESDARRLQEMWTDWGIVAWWLNEITDRPVKEVKNTQHLAVVMQKYCDIHCVNIEDEKKKIYENHNVTSRADLKEVDIQNLIESYTLGIYE